MPRSKVMSSPVKSVPLSFNRHKWLWLPAGIIAVVVDRLLELLTQPGVATGLNLWIVIVWSAFIWLAVRLDGSDKLRPSMSKIFYEGTGAFLKQFLILGFWVICLVPFVIGGVVFTEVSVTLFDPSGLEIAIVAAIWLVLAVLSTYLIIRTLFAPVLVLEKTPAKAIGESWRLTKRRVSWLSLRTIVWLVVLLVPAIAIQYSVIAELLTGSILIWTADTLSTVLTYVVVLPAMATLIHRLYLHEKTRNQQN